MLCSSFLAKVGFTFEKCIIWSFLQEEMLADEQGHNMIIL